MTTPSAELMITPEVSQTAIKKMQDDFKKGFKKVGNDAQKQIEKDVGQGVTGGLKNVGRKITGAFRGAGRGIAAGFNKIGGFKAIGGSILGAGLIGAFRTLERANQGAGVIGGFLGQSTAQQQIATATGAGLTTAQFAQFSETLRQSGFNEQQDINDVIFDINERVAQAETDEGVQTLENYKGQRGFDLLTGVLSGLASMDTSEQSLALADLGFGGETGQNLQATFQEAQRQAYIARGYSEERAAAFVKGEDLNASNGIGIIPMLSQKEIRTQLEEANKTEGERLAGILEAEAVAAKDFREKTLKQQIEMREALVAGVGKEGVLDTYFKEQERVNKDNITSVENFVENQKAATTVQEGIDKTLQQVEKATTSLIAWLEDNFGGSMTLEEKEEQARVLNVAKELGFDPLTGGRIKRD